MSNPDLEITARTQLRRRRDRGSFDRAVVYSILDEALVCHVGFEGDRGVVVLPMTYVRIDDTLYLHGATANDMLRHLIDRTACITVTLLDGLVLARSAFRHSMNYRSVVLFGPLRRVSSIEEMQAASRALLDHLVPGRAADPRPPNAIELQATLLLALAINEGSAKVRAGGPLDDDADLALPVWAGQIPLRLTRATPQPADRVDAPIPSYLVQPAFDHLT